MNSLVPLLLNRCERLLHSGIPDTVVHAGDLREEVLGEFAELLAQDGSGDNPDELDFYEVRFNMAFQALRIDVLRTQLPRVANEVSLSEMQEPNLSVDDAYLPRFSADLLASDTHEQALALRDLLNTLPPTERQAVVLCHVMGYDEESEDPNKTTAATICGVTGRTIRNRLNVLVRQPKSCVWSERMPNDHHD